jgi:hypothetical protein
VALGGKFKFPAQDSDLEYLIWRSKNPPVSSDLKPPLIPSAGVHHMCHESRKCFILSASITIAIHNMFFNKSFETIFLSNYKLVGFVSLQNFL